MEEKILLEATVVFPVRDGHVLLAKKTRKIGMGCWNGYGGGVEEEDVSIEATALRELKQESGIVGVPSTLSKIAVCYFSNSKSDGMSFTAKVHVYLVWEWEGEPKSTEEMSDPTWFPVEALPFEKMMPADRYWVPRVLAGERLIVRASYGPLQKELISPVEVILCMPEELV